MVQFTKPVQFENCLFKEFDIYANYFAAGLIVKDCAFECDILWQSGGHNVAPIIFENCEFFGFVDFEDCCFDGDFILKKVAFHKNTNLLGNKNTPVAVLFESAPKLENVVGKLDVDTFKK